MYYGPMHGWWMFPFERIIGALQKTNTNYKIGELEKTMLETFCAATNIKAMVQDPTGPAILNEAMTILGQYCDPFTGGNIHTKMDILLAGRHDCPITS
ncbi:uncharacterized protein EDB93DRAFT_1085087 [Suillus bovinus]|uniref:uncharacterized protein n=1 Tax=Suillus bovinus TaxID=48563 RepID=UPI001B864B9F|nr:uncharacterized protein EDB93DRAFT_1085087 [Suillus bovinus]KAG2148241.1 hypothetical protein EDB93DRAFT_1085087 [Suillus bovinus]